MANKYHVLKVHKFFAMFFNPLRVVFNFDIFDKFGPFFTNEDLGGILLPYYLQRVDYNLPDP